LSKFNNNKNIFLSLIIYSRWSLSS